MTTGAAATSRSASESIAAATRSNITRIKKTRRPSRSRLITLAMRMTLAKVRCGLLGKMPKARHYSPEMKKGLDGVLAEMEDVAKTINRIYGPSHPYAKEINGMTTFARTLKLEHAPLFRSN